MDGVAEAFDIFFKTVKTEEKDGKVKLFQKDSVSAKADENWNKEAQEILSKAVKGVEVKYLPNSEMKENSLGYFEPTTGTIFINKDKATKDTIFHEFTHPFINHIKDSNRKLYDEGINLIKNTAYVGLVQASQPGLNEADTLDEALVHAIGLKGAEIKDVQDRNKFLAWLRKIFFKFKQFIRKINGKQPTLDAFTESIARDLQAGRGSVRAVSYTHLTLPTNREV